MKTIFIILYCYSVLTTFMYLRTNELYKKPLWMSWVAGIFWPVCLVAGTLFILYTIVTGLIGAIPRWYRRYKWQRSYEYKEKMAQFDAAFGKE